jgi:4-amino-4-deoxy-L-arabinose transferase-like glycosyltransferase
MKFNQPIGVLKIITFSIILVLILPDLVQHGMFMDGTQYACVSRDLAVGKGSFWFPHLSDSWLKNGSSDFMEHLPLAYFLQSRFFLLFGDSIYAEKIYCFCCLLLSVLFINKIWNLLPFENKTLKRNSWLPLLLWITCASVFWAYQNNLLEITISVFVLASVYFMLKAIYNAKWQFLNIFISGICIFLSSLSKGLPGLFPLAGVILFYFTCRNLSIKKTLLYSATLLVVPFLIYFLLYFFNEDAKESIHFYLYDRLFYRVNNDPLVDNRLVILFWLFTDMLLPIILIALLMVLFKFKAIKNTLSTERKKLIAFFLLFGLAGVFPLALTYVQRAVYFIPALPFFAIGLSLCIVNGIEELKKRINIEKHYQKIKHSSYVILLGVLISCALLIGKTSRDEDMLKDVGKIGSSIPAGSYVDVPENVYELWDFQFYLLRYNNIVLWNIPNKNSKYYLTTKPASPENIANYQPVNINLKNYELFKKTK